ncbi:ankyrin [Trametes punicea]|nr:ankyrin [Trametes punicea]
MQQLLDRPGFLPRTRGGSRLRDLYRETSVNFDTSLLNGFAKACFFGSINTVRMAVESGLAPDLRGQETPHKHGYVALTLFGAQHLEIKPSSRLDHSATLRYLLAHGAPPDVPDVLGLTALHHASMAYARADFARILLEHGANPDHQNRFGSVPLMEAFEHGAIDVIEVLMEFGARLDIEDADGDSPNSVFLRYGPRVTAVVQKWKRKRAGEANPVDQKACATCGKADVQLKWCAKCHTTWYCSKECQKLDWPSHKQVCIPYDEQAAVTLKPVYEGCLSVMPMTELLGQEPVSKLSSRKTRGAQIPDIPVGKAKKMIVKVQVPFDFEKFAPSTAEVGDLMVYDKKRTFVCRIRKADNPDAYMRVSRAVREKGVGGAKAYFSAEMESPDKLVLRVSEVLSEQAF